MASDFNSPGQAGRARWTLEFLYRILTSIRSSREGSSPRMSYIGVIGTRRIRNVEIQLWLSKDYILWIILKYFFLLVILRFNQLVRRIFNHSRSFRSWS